jgi:RimJ/RimL family protein N-acetyltransferase
MLFLRDAQLQDAAMLCEAEQDIVSTYDGMLVSEPEELSEENFRERIATLADGRGKYLIAEVERQPVAHASLWPMGLKNVSHVLRLDMCVHRGHWRRGYGEALLRALLTWANRPPGARKIELLVRSENTAAVSLYRKVGFIEEGRLRGRVRLRSGRYVDDLSMALLLVRGDA